MNDLVHRLRRAYERELQLYAEVERLGREGVRVVEDRRPLNELNEINSRKQRVLEDIAQVESSIAADKDAWRRGAAVAVTGRELDDVLDQLRACIERILELEKESERRIVESSGILEERVAAQ